MGLYIGAGLGPGPRDGLMTGVAAKGFPLWAVAPCSSSPRSPRVGSSEGTSGSGPWRSRSASAHSVISSSGVSISKTLPRTSGPARWANGAVRIGVIGTGIGARVVAPVFAATEGCDVVDVVGA